MPNGKATTAVNSDNILEGPDSRPYTRSDVNQLLDRLSQVHGGKNVRVHLTDTGHVYIERKLSVVKPGWYRPEDEVNTLTK